MVVTDILSDSLILDSIRVLTKGKVLGLRLGLFDVRFLVYVMSIVWLLMTNLVQNLVNLVIIDCNQKW